MEACKGRLVVFKEPVAEKERDKIDDGKKDATTQRGSLCPIHRTSAQAPKLTSEVDLLYVRVQHGDVRRLVLAHVFACEK